MLCNFGDPIPSVNNKLEIHLRGYINSARVTFIANSKYFVYAKKYRSFYHGIFGNY